MYDTGDINRINKSSRLFKNELQLHTQSSANSESALHHIVLISHSAFLCPVTCHTYGLTPKMLRYELCVASLS